MTHPKDNRPVTTKTESMKKSPTQQIHDSFQLDAATARLMVPSEYAVRRLDPEQLAAFEDHLLRDEALRREPIYASGLRRELRYYIPAGVIALVGMLFFLAGWVFEGGPEQPGFAWFASVFGAVVAAPFALTFLARALADPSDLSEYHGMRRWVVEREGVSDRVRAVLVDAARAVERIEASPHWHSNRSHRGQLDLRQQLAEIKRRCLRVVDLQHRIHALGDDTLAGELDEQLELVLDSARTRVEQLRRYAEHLGEVDRLEKQLQQREEALGLVGEVEDLLALTGADQVTAEHLGHLTSDLRVQIAALQEAKDLLGDDLTALQTR
ncbi:hypothetical protein CGZ98_06190 [Enemella evansiae]|uniref:hypothetical protein n=1 Tax=Enemella evansiae TaxID=2016499 RepID=UPI000B96343A|nr:hypothetical protein [Enemella evansiae]OYO13131.1 hypothetical protein CGZ98_06190 [Enemella evansiae]